MDPFTEGIVVASISGTLLLGYHAILVYLIWRHTLVTVIGLTRDARRVWVMKIMEKPDSILGVQTLRNWVMSSSQLASTAVVILLALTAFIPIPGRSGQSLLAAPTDDPTLIIKMAMLCVSFMVAFFAFTQSMRYFNHVSVLLAAGSIPPADPPQTPLEYWVDDNPVAIQKFAASLFNRGAMFHTIGMRCYYCTFPIILWFFGHWALFGGMVALLTILAVLDYTGIDYVRTKRRGPYAWPSPVLRPAPPSVSSHALTQDRNMESV
ncbi:uncharacterized protein BJ171DRAFT_490110 [Polychytrium aggregatum]|uniref:uncharacterized protein n=1 Tax=Polychytrium aggregatum TaxID=110093 RepID=UPI0022FEC70C|nr:uncharacterized protein BJ171DRAFT_490110 [Polychytrium aggregatum]KAI9208057.1 hypothetical protein BJ171DRAFT_490110 [Polychytrium aggregatum]